MAQKGSTDPMGRTLFRKVWDDHLVVDSVDGPSILYIDLHLVHEVTSPQAFEGLRLANRKVRRADKTVGTVDHSIPTRNQSAPIEDPIARAQVETLRKNANEFGIIFFDVESGFQGIVHVIGPELGFTLPGSTIVCGDSHTATHGAFGAIALGIGSSDVEHVLATQCLRWQMPNTMELRIDGSLAQGVSAKDLILYVINKIGVGGGTGSVIEYTGQAVRDLSMEGRLTVCNMSIECGARAGMIAPDDTTFEYLRGRKYAPRGRDFEQAVERWSEYSTDPDAEFDRSITLNAEMIEPMVTWGTQPAMSAPIGGVVPDPASFSDANERSSVERSLEYMGLEPGIPIEEIAIDRVFIGSCTNSRIEDLREAASVVKGFKVASGVDAMVVPGSESVKRLAEDEGLAEVFVESGFDWREPGCSMCLAMNPDRLEPFQRCASTSNRNFEGRQGPNGRTHLVSPATAAASAIAGHFVDVREFDRNGGTQL